MSFKQKIDLFIINVKIVVLQSMIFFVTLYCLSYDDGKSLDPGPDHEVRHVGLLATKEGGPQSPELRSEYFAMVRNVSFSFPDCSYSR